MMDGEKARDPQRSASAPPPATRAGTPPQARKPPQTPLPSKAGTRGGASPAPSAPKGVPADGVERALAWRPVGPGHSHRIGSPQRIVDDLLSMPEGLLHDGSMVVRPSLRAAAERFLTVFTTLLALALPFVIAAAIRSTTGQNVDVDPSPIPVWGAWAAMDVVLSLFIPAVVSLGPAIQIAFTRYIFDDEGIRERIQFLSRTERRVAWEKVTALHHRRTFFDRLLGIERLDIVAYGERGTTLHLVGLRDAPRLRGLVARQMRREATLGNLVAND